VTPLRALLALTTTMTFACAPQRRVDQPTATVAPTTSVTATTIATPKAVSDVAPRVILLVWDGLRPDSVDAAVTPRLAALAARGTVFTDHHATYPTFTMMNAGSFATGSFVEQTGFYGNTLFQPGAAGKNAEGQPLPFEGPIFTEDYWVLSALDASAGSHLLLADTLFQAAKKAGRRTATVGKSGAAFLQDLGKGDVVLDERVVFPESFAEALKGRGFALPGLADKASGTALKADNGAPTTFGPKKYFDDGVTPDPSDQGGSPFHSANRYLMDTFTEGVLPLHSPELSVVWLRNPDTTEHVYGPGTSNVKDALASQDLLLGMLLDRLQRQGFLASTDLLVVSDHAHSSVSGPLDLFPLRKVKKSAAGTGNTWGDPAPDGFSVSGDVRLAHLLSQAKFIAYDGVGCVYDPVLSGITASGAPVMPDKLDASGKLCGKAGTHYTTPSYKVPKGALAKGALIVAPNGGSDYVYVPDHDAATVTRLVRFLQSREELGAMFVATRYGALPGTLPMAELHLESTAERSPDLVVSYNHDENAVVQGMRGTVFQSAQLNNQRGMHGSFSSVDVHNTLIAAGPHFRAGFSDALPSGNVDVAPTVARLLGLSLPRAQGRVLEEALLPGRQSTDYVVSPGKLGPQVPATGLVMERATGARDPSKTTYTFEIRTKDLKLGSASFRYFDGATVLRR
jgi:arylsulfatase A-like enzyme